ncbi:MAG TPA: hypothetical protein VLN44_02925 [Pyrinomonadaceae bacterium]|nr:hypothetical protein [Pyrinomonadaceae bacterium]
MNLNHTWLSITLIDDCEQKDDEIILEMDEETKRLAEEVGTAINESVQQSASVAAAIERLREAGFEMELTLKLEIGLRPHAMEDQPSSETSGSFEFTEEDLRVLRSMKIKTEPAEE